MRPTSLLHSARLQVKVIGALVIREMHTRFGRENIGFLWIIGEPALFCVGVSIMWTLIRPSHENGIPVTAFVITGYVPLTLWRHAMYRGVKAFESNAALMYHRQVTPIDILVARMILEIYGVYAAGAILLAGAVFLGYADVPVDFGIMFLGMFYMILFAFGTAFLCAALTERSELVEKFVQVFSYLSIPFSGCFTMVDWVPKQFQHILLWSPSVHAMEMIREGQFGPTSHPHYDVAFVTSSTVLLLIVGLSLVLRSRKYILVQ